MFSLIKKLSSYYLKFAQQLQQLPVSKTFIDQILLEVISTANRKIHDYYENGEYDDNFFFKKIYTIDNKKISVLARFSNEINAYAYTEDNKKISVLARFSNEINAYAYTEDNSVILEININDILNNNYNYLAQQLQSALHHELTHVLFDNYSSTHNEFHYAILDYIDYVNHGINRNKAFELLYSQNPNLQSLLMEHRDAITSLPLTELNHYSESIYLSLPEELEAAASEIKLMIDSNIKYLASQYKSSGPDFLKNQIHTMALTFDFNFSQPILDQLVEYAQKQILQSIKPKPKLFRKHK